MQCTFDSYLTCWRELSKLTHNIIGIITTICSYTKKTIWHLAIWFYHSKICKIEKWTLLSVFLLRGKSERIESIHFAESLGLRCWETEKEVLIPITQFWEIRHSYNSLRNCLAPQNVPLNLNYNAWQKHHSNYYSSFLNTHQAVACSGAKAVKVSNSEKH